jgi:hypothetical protein
MVNNILQYIVNTIYCCAALLHKTKWWRQLRKAPSILYRRVIVLHVDPFPLSTQPIDHDRLPSPMACYFGCIPAGDRGRKVSQYSAHQVETPQRFISKTKAVRCVGREQSDHRSTVPGNHGTTVIMKQNENVSWADVVRTQKPKQMATIANSKNVSRGCELILSKQSRE